MIKRSEFERYSDRFDDLRIKRRVLTRAEVEAAFADGVDAGALADRNDELAYDYDSILSAETR